VRKHYPKSKFFAGIRTLDFYSEPNSSMTNNWFESLTRTVALINSSRFLRFTPASKNVSAGLKPGYAHLHSSWLCVPLQIRGSETTCTAMLHHRLRTSSCTVIVFWSPSSLYRDRAFLAPICTMTAKTRAVVRSLRPY